MTKFRIGKKYVRGNKKGRRFNEIITLDSEDIQNYLWDTVIAFENSKIDHVIEYHRKYNKIVL